MRPLSRYEQQRLDATFRRVFREDARSAQHSRCAYCRDPLTVKTATADHVVPRAEFGLDHRNNIVAACAPCNRAKGKASEKEFRQRIERPRRGDRISVWLAWARRRINLRLELMARSLGVE